MSLRLKPAAIAFMVMVAGCGFADAAGAATVVGVYPFQDTGASPPSHYGNGSYPESELLQASDGNYYGTTEQGGSGVCPSDSKGDYIGCGTIFRINAATGTETVLYSFPYDLATRTAPNGAFPLAGLIQGQDGALYGVTSNGGLPGCDLQAACGTLFSISTTGKFTLLHQFCGRTGCPGVVEGGDPISHLVQAADGTLYGTTFAGGDNNYGTLFSASTSGVVKTLHYFLDTTDGYEPAGALLIGRDGSTLYGTAEFGGEAYGGTAFSYGAAGLTIIHSFGSGSGSDPGALIYGADGLLYGTGAGATGGTIFSMTITGSGFAMDATFPGRGVTSSLLLGSDGMMYGPISGVRSNPNGGVIVYNPTTKTAQPLIAFTTDTGGEPDAALIEGKDHYLYGTNSSLGGSNSLGPDSGTLYRVGPPLSP